MITVANRIPVKPEAAEVFEETFRKRLGSVDSFEGFIAFQLLRPKKPDDPYVVLTFWEQESHFRAWTLSDDFREQHRGSRETAEAVFSGPIKIEIHDVVQESGATLSAAN
jgi:heme-degrading monooxygenase HmoA